MTFVPRDIGFYIQETIFNELSQKCNLYRYIISKLTPIIDHIFFNKKRNFAIKKLYHLQTKLIKTKRDYFDRVKNLRQVSPAFYIDVKSIIYVFDCSFQKNMYSFIIFHGKYFNLDFYYAIFPLPENHSYYQLELIEIIKQMNRMNNVDYHFALQDLAIRRRIKIIQWSARYSN